MTIDELINQISSGWHRASDGLPVTVSIITQIEHRLGVKFPDDYVRFILWSNGGEGLVGNSYFCLWPIEQLEEMNDLLNINKYLPGFLLIGGDTADLGYAFEFDRQTIHGPRLFQVPRGDLGQDTAILVGPSFLSGLINIHQGFTSD